MKGRFALLLMMGGLIATGPGCNKRPLDVLRPCTINAVAQNVPVNPQRALDVLFIIDNSPSMEDEQAKLRDQVPRLIDLLLSGAVDDDSVEDFPAVQELHVGFVTTDLGYSSPTDEWQAGIDFNPTDACDDVGDAGFLQSTGFLNEMVCTAQTPPSGIPYLEYPQDGAITQQELVDDVECLTSQQSPSGNACGFEQQLEAILAQKCNDPSDADCRNSANVGFSRADSLLAVILITDEDDCSTTDPRVFDVTNLSEGAYFGPKTSGGDVQFNLRCWEHREALHDIERYVDGIAALKDDPSQVVFAAITGIPQDPDLDLENFQTPAERYAAILAHPDMVEVPNPAQDDQQNQQLSPACDAGAAGTALPATRILETISGLADPAVGVGTVVESICADDYSDALGTIVNQIAEALRQLCLPRALNRNPNDMVNCQVRETLPEGVNCDESAGRTEVGETDPADGPVRKICQITQLPSDPGAGTPDGIGWFYDDFSADTKSQCSFNPTPQRVNFTAGAAPQAGSRVRFECIEAAPPNSVDIGWPCSSDNDCERSAESLREQYSVENLALICDPLNNTCQLDCQNDAQCPGGMSCYDADGDGPGAKICVNPNCQIN